MNNKQKSHQTTVQLSDAQLIALVMEKHKNTPVLFPKMLESAKAALSGIKTITDSLNKKGA